MATYVPNTRISLRRHRELTEKWLQSVIADDPTVLGLGEVDVKDLERSQPRAGRLDMLLFDPETNTRYEVELQLGPTDESHIIRTIEYWDIERRRFPQYEHVGVIVAEEITTRFFNVISHFSGFIPIVAIQVNAIEVAGALTLVFTKVLDVMPLGLAEEEDDEEPVDRTYWETQKGSPESLLVADRLLELTREVEPDIKLKYIKHYVGLDKNGAAVNFVTLRPRRKDHVIAEFKADKTDDLTGRVEDSGLDSLGADRWSNYPLRVRDEDITEEGEVLRELIKLSRDAYGGHL